jgi:flagellar protein FliO/FliZ
MLDLFGTEMPLAAKFFIAFAVVLALIGLTAWVVRRIGANRLGGAGARGRQPRLAVIDAASVDARRRLVLIRRDNVEHLLMIGGPTDVVVEANIVRAVGAARDAGREQGRAEPATRGSASTTAEMSWPLQPNNEPAPALPPRSYRASPTEEPWHAPEPGARPRPADSLTGLAAELSTRLNPPEQAAQTPRIDAAPRMSAAPEPAAEPQSDHNLAEMAQQLEAALRRPPENRPPVTDPLAATANASQRNYKLRIDPRLEPKFEAPKPDKAEPRLEPRLEPRSEPKFESKFEPKSEPRFDAKFDAKPEPRLDSPAPATAMPSKDAYDNLEEEMASLLGRPTGKT